MKNKPLLMAIAVLFIATSSVAQVTGTFTDSRDGKAYKTVTIGTQTWMAENLNFNTNFSGNINGTDSWCNTIDDMCVTYGRLYTYEAAKKYACPSGWHLPSDADWKTLIDFLGGEKIAGNKLKSTTAWKISEKDTAITNSSGFTALPGGWGQEGMLNSKKVTFSFPGTEGCWWSSTPDPNSNIYYRCMSNHTCPN
jgi:uncharacterized protein (TIGR02145 family)